LTDRYAIELVEKRNEIKIKKEKKANLRKKLDKLETEQGKIQSELHSVTTKLMYYYHKILNEWVDIRNEGLIWVIKAVWNLGHPILPGYLPNFLEEKTVVYLFDVSVND